MTEPVSPILESELHAYVDRMLPDERSAQVEAYLAANPEEGEKVRFYRALNGALHNLFDLVLNEPVPLNLQPAHVKPSSLVKQCALILVSLVLGTAIGWSAHGFFYKGPGTDGMSWPRSAAMAHLVYSPERRHAVEVGAAEEQHLVKWLSKRLGFPLKIPNLSDQGYELVGGRLLPGNQGPVANFMYQDRTGQRLTLYVRTDIKGAPTTAFRFYEEGQVRVFYWLDGPVGYALSGRVQKDELLRVARVIYQELTS